MSKEVGQGLFEGASALPESSDIYAKTSALADDYFRRGKPVEWVIENVCGTRLAQRRMVLSMAQAKRLITAEQRKELGKRYLGEKDTNKFSKR